MKQEQVLVHIKNWGGDVPVLGEVRRFSYKEANGRLSFYDLSESEARRMLASIALAGRHIQGEASSPTSVADTPETASSVHPISPKPESADSSRAVPPEVRAEQVADDAASAPPSSEEMLDADDPPVTVTQGKDTQAAASKAVAEVAAEPDKPKRRARKPRKKKEPEPTVEPVNGGLAPEGAEAAETPTPPWDEKQEADDAADAKYEAEERAAIQAESAPEPEPAKAKSNGKKSNGKKSNGVELDMEVVKSKTKLRAILSYMIDQGYASPEAIVDKCLDMRQEVPILSRVANLSERIPRTLELLGWPEG